MGRKKREYEVLEKMIFVPAFIIEDLKNESKSWGQTRNALLIEILERYKDIKCSCNWRSFQSKYKEIKRIAEKESLEKNEKTRRDKPLRAAIPLDLATYIQARAKEQGVTLTTFIITAITYYFNQSAESEELRCKEKLDKIRAIINATGAELLEFTSPRC